MNSPALLEVKGLSKTFPARGGLFRKAAQDTTVLEEIGFSVYPGESLGIVGGSGSGKTTLGRSILQLIRPGHGQVLYKGRDLCALSEGEMRGQRRFVQLIFQDPYASLNPQMTVGRAILEAMRVHGVGADDRDRKNKVLTLLERVDLRAEHFDRYPHQFSGGQRQRIVIARTMALGPELVICDESVSALDVSVQAQVLNLLNDLKDEYGLTYLFISHDLNVVRYFCDRIMVLDKGRIAEIGPSPTVYADPQAEATKRLLAAIPGRSV